MEFYMKKVIRGMQFLLDQRLQPQVRESPLSNGDYVPMVESLFGTLEEGVPVILESPTFRAVVTNALGKEPEILPISTYREAQSYIQGKESQFQYCSFGGSEAKPDDPCATFFALTRDREHMFINERTLIDYEELHTRFLNAVSGV